MSTGTSRSWRSSKIASGGKNIASDQEFVEFVLDQTDDSGGLSFGKMFGKYALYCESKVVALICDDKLFVKPTGAGREFIGEVVEAPAYPGAKDSFLIEEQLDDGDWLSRLIRITTKALPQPKPKKKRTKHT